MIKCIIQEAFERERLIMKYYLGMDIGGTKCAVVLSEKSGVAVKDKIRFETKAR